MQKSDVLHEWCGGSWLCSDRVMSSCIKAGLGVGRVLTSSWAEGAESLCSDVLMHHGWAGCGVGVGDDLQKHGWAEFEIVMPRSYLAVMEVMEGR